MGKATATKTAGKKAVVKKAAKKTAKKAAPEKAAVQAAKDGPAEKDAKKIHLKYEDKSAGQPELMAIFHNIKKMMEPYDKKRAVILHADKPSQANLVSHKPVVIDGRPRDEVWFVSALVQKGYVGFYHRPVYPPAEMKKHFSEVFVKSLKGKSCFHITKNTPEIMADIKKAIRLGYESYIEKGWI